MVGLSAKMTNDEILYNRINSLKYTWFFIFINLCWFIGHKKHNLYCNNILFARYCSRCGNILWKRTPSNETEFYEIK